MEEHFWNGFMGRFDKAGLALQEKRESKKASHRYAFLFGDCYFPKSIAPFQLPCRIAFQATDS